MRHLFTAPLVLSAAAVILSAVTSSAGAPLTHWQGMTDGNSIDPLSWDNGIAWPGNTTMFAAGTTDVLFVSDEPVNDIQCINAEAYTFDSGFIRLGTLSHESGNIANVHEKPLPPGRIL